MTSSILDGPRTVADGRAEVDDIDDQLLVLLGRRRAVSQQIQALRIAAGGARVEHGRENVVVRRYVDRLGSSGVDLALAVLEHCRGRV